MPRTTKTRDRKSTRLNSSHTEIYTLSLHDALPIYPLIEPGAHRFVCAIGGSGIAATDRNDGDAEDDQNERSEEHTSELQSHRDLHSFPTRRSSDLSLNRTGRPQVRLRDRRVRYCGDGP